MGELALDKVRSTAQRLRLILDQITEAFLTLLMLILVAQCLVPGSYVEQVVAQPGPLVLKWLLDPEIRLPKLFISGGYVLLYYQS